MVSKLTIVMPAYNEAATIEAVVAEVLKQPSVCELIIVDDCSTDETWTKVEAIKAGDERVRIYRHDQNHGKGGGVADGFPKCKR